MRGASKMRGAVITAVLIAAACGTRLFPIPNAIAEEDDPTDEKYAGDYRKRQYDAGLKRKPPKKPADPWAAIDGDTPKSVTEKHMYFPNTDANDCSAAHDHCLPDWAWIVESEQDTKKHPTRRMANVLRVIDGKLDHRTWVRSYHYYSDPIAYRSVPATKKNIAKGNLVAVFPYPNKAPSSEKEAMAAYWTIGFVNTIDWDGGKLRLVGDDEPYWLSATRVLVLKWQPGGKVEMVGKRKREELAVNVSDVFLPTSDAGTIADPWSVVGKDGMPIETKDTVKLEGSSAVPCDSAHDHCLRPWVWFTEDGIKHIPAIYKDGKMQKVFDLDYIREIGGPGAMAYRTVPATVDNIKEGSLVFFVNSNVGSESGAFGADWMRGKVVEIQPEAGMFLVEGDKRYYKIELARVAVVQWFPGEKAEAVP